MKIIPSSNDIEQLKDLPIKERQALLAKAEKKLTAPEKLVLNLLKLVMLVPPFYFLARQEWGNFVLTIVVSLVFFAFIFKRVLLRFLSRHLS